MPERCGALLLIAAKAEADALRLAATPPAGGPPADLGGGLSLLVAGVGRSGDEPVQRCLAELRPKLVINVGFAGALEPSLAAGSLHIVDRWVDPEPPYADVAKSSRSFAGAIITELSRNGIEAPRATALTVEGPFHDDAARRELARASGAALVEMEGARWALAAVAADAAHVALRVVSDHADLRLPRPCHELLGVDGGVRWARWAGALATSRGHAGWVHELASLRRARADWRRALATMAPLGELLPAVCRAIADEAGAAAFQSSSDQGWLESSS